MCGRLILDCGSRRRVSSGGVGAGLGGAVDDRDLYSKSCWGKINSVNELRFRVETARAIEVRSAGEGRDGGLRRSTTGLLR
jgi:hypothetical protein